MSPDSPPRTGQPLKGHGLWFEGAPHDDHGKRIGWRGVSGEGRARCSCGALSEPLPSASQRKAWHRTHKAEVVEAGGSERCPHSRRADGKHSWAFDGDDPYIYCVFCAEYRDALTGRTILGGTKDA